MVFISPFLKQETRKGGQYREKKSRNLSVPALKIVNLFHSVLLPERSTLSRLTPSAPFRVSPEPVSTLKDIMQTARCQGQNALLLKFSS
jgi:hypothetical protein